MNDHNSRTNGNETVISIRLCRNPFINPLYSNYLDLCSNHWAEEEEMTSFRSFKFQFTLKATKHVYNISCLWTLECQSWKCKGEKHTWIVWPMKLKWSRRKSVFADPMISFIANMSSNKIKIMPVYETNKMLKII